MALWREGLLARAVLAGRTRGYRRHPQLERFRGRRDPVAAVDCYLSRVLDEARARGYAFDATKIRYRRCAGGRTSVTAGQLSHEWEHLLAKLKARDRERWREARRGHAGAHPCFRVVPGPVAGWERVSAGREASGGALRAPLPGGTEHGALPWHLKGAIVSSEMEKRTPTYDLAGFREEFSSVRALRMTRTAQDATLRLGMTLQDVVQVVQGMTRRQFYKSMTSHADHRVWQDVYHVPWGPLVLYVKLTMDDLGRLILSMKEK